MTLLRGSHSVLKRRVLSLLWAAALLLGALPAVSAPSQSDYDAIQAKLSETRQLLAQAEARERALRRSIAQNTTKRRALQAEIDELNAELRIAQVQVDVAESELGTVNQHLMAKSGELDDMLARLGDATTALERRAAQVYMAGPFSFIQFVVGATSFSDLATRVQFLAGIFANDDETIRKVSEQRDRVREEIRAIEALKTLSATQVRLVAAKRNQVASLRNVIASRKRELDRALSAQYETLEDVRESKAAYLKRQRELEKESRRIAELLSGRTGGTASVGKGGMAWPVQGKLTSPYGWRTHPIHGDTRFHDGIDVAASQGTPLRSAASGTVIFAGRKGGYGNTVIVEHGGGLATVYAHMSSIGAGEGAKLDRGETLGRVGCTGSCTGPHVHFEVRVGGKTQNPLTWLP